MMDKKLTEKRMQTKLNNFYKKHYGESDFDEFYVNPKDNVWKFNRDGKTIILVCDEYTGEVEAIER